MTDIYDVYYDNEHRFTTSNLTEIKDFIQGKYASKLELYKNGVMLPRDQLSLSSENIIGNLKRFRTLQMINHHHHHLPKELFEL